MNPYLTPEAKANELKQHMTTAPGSTVKKVAVLYSSYEGCKSETNDVDVHQTSPRFWCPGPDVSGLDFVDISLTKQTGEKAIKDIVASGASALVALDTKSNIPDVADARTTKPDVFFNMCDGAFYEPRAGLGVTRALEQEGAAWAGSPTWCWETSKSDMKLMLAGNDKVLCPGAASIETDALDVDAQDAETERVARNVEILKPLVAHLSFPVLIKPPAGLASIGMKASSKCDSLEALEKELRTVARAAQCGASTDAAGIGTSTMVEEFVVGGEATVFVSEKGVEGEFHAFPPVGFELPDPNSFFHFDFKWDQNVVLSARGRKMDPNTQIVKDMQAASLEAFKVIMGGQSYGRCDFRISAKDGKAYFLEINPCCGLMYPWDPEDPNGLGEDREAGKDWMHGDLADMAILQDPHFSHLDFVQWQIAAAERRQIDAKPWWFNKKAQGSTQCVTTRAVTKGRPLFGPRATPAACSGFSPRGATSKMVVGRCDGILALEMASLDTTQEEGNIGWLTHPGTGCRFLGALGDIPSGTVLNLQVDKCF